MLSTPLLTQGSNHDFVAYLTRLNVHLSVCFPITCFHSLLHSFFHIQYTKNNGQIMRLHFYISMTVLIGKGYLIFSSKLKTRWKAFEMVSPYATMIRAENDQSDVHIFRHTSSPQYGAVLQTYSTFLAFSLAFLISTTTSIPNYWNVNFYLGIGYVWWDSIKTAHVWR